jgi:hypothetical protein
MLNALQTLSDNGCSDHAMISLLEDIIGGNSFEEDDDKRCCIALLHNMQEGNHDEASDYSIDYGDIVKTPHGDFRVLDDDEAIEAYDDYLEQMLDDSGCVPGADSPYFDRGKWKNDAVMGGCRGASLAGYDGNEYELSVGGDWYYLYRVN